MTHPQRTVLTLTLTGAGLLAVLVVVGLILSGRNRVDEETHQRLLDISAKVGSGRIDEFQGWLLMRDEIRAAQHRTGNYSEGFKKAAEKDARDLLDHAHEYRMRHGD